MIEVTVPAKLFHFDHTNSILLGPTFGLGTLPNGEILEISGSGKTLRFQLRGKDGYVEMPLTDIANRALEMLQNETS